MEIIGALSTVDSLSGRVIGLVRDLVMEIDRAQNDVASLPAEAENLQEQYEKLSDRVTRVQDANSYLRKVHTASIKEGELEKLLTRLDSSLQSDLRLLKSIKKEEQKQRWLRRRECKKVFWALIGKGAAKVQKQIKEVVRRMEEDCRQLDEAITVRSFTGGVRTEAAVDRLEKMLRDQGLKTPDEQSSMTVGAHVEIFHTTVIIQSSGAFGKTLLATLSLLHQVGGLSILSLWSMARAYSAVEHDSTMAFLQSSSGKLQSGKDVAAGQAKRSISRGLPELTVFHSQSGIASDFIRTWEQIWKQSDLIPT